MNLVEIIVRVKADVDRGLAGARLSIDRFAASVENRLRDMSNTSGGRIGSLIGMVGKLGTSLIQMGNNGAQGLAILGSSLVPIVGLVIALLGFLSEIVAALASVGLAVGAFGALAYPIFGKITAGVQAVGAAANKVARDKAWDAIPKALQPAVKTILDIKDAWQKMSDSMLPLVGRIASTIANIVQKLLPLIKPLADVAGRAIENFLKRLDQAASSGSFRQFIAQMTALSGPSMKATANGFLQLGGAIGQFLKDISSSGQGPGGITAIFTTLAFAIRLLGAGLRFAQLELRGTEIIFGTLAHVGIIAAKAIGDAFMTTFGAISQFGSHIPLLGHMFKGWADSAASFQKTFDSSMNDAITSVKNWTTTVTNAPKVAKLQANIQNLMTNLAIARQNLLNPDLTKTRRAQIEANIDRLIAAVAAAKAQLASIQNRTVYINSVYTQPGTPGSTGGYASGGIVGAASGMIASGLRMVGEQGRELVRLPAGSQVFSHPDTERMLSQRGGGGGGTIKLVVVPGGQTEFERLLALIIRRFVRVYGQGNVQTAFGSR